MKLSFKSMIKNIKWYDDDVIEWRKLRSFRVFKKILITIKKNFPTALGSNSFYHFIFSTNPSPLAIGLEIITKYKQLACKAAGSGSFNCRYRLYIPEEQSVCGAVCGAGYKQSVVIKNNVNVSQAKSKQKIIFIMERPLKSCKQQHSSPFC